MSELVDARGLSCPQPVLMTMDRIKAMGQGELEVLVDTETSSENVGRAAKKLGWQLAGVQNEGEGYKLTLKK